MQVAEKGDIIQWDFKGEDYIHLPEHLKGKTFKAEVVAVFKLQREYGVYASYGQDYIGFNDCKIIKRKSK